MNTEDELVAAPLPVQPPAPPEPAETRFLKWVIFGGQGVRVGWSIALFLVIMFIASFIAGSIAFAAMGPGMQEKFKVFAPKPVLIQECLQFFPLLVAAAVSALIERRSILDYNLRGSHRLRHFFVGIAGGIAALSALVGALHLGGWLQFGTPALSGAAIAQMGGLWAFGFLLTGFSEEGLTRCYMLFTLTRGVNYWWALGSVACFSLLALINPHGNGNGGVYLMAALGVIPCLLLHLKNSSSAGFWEAAWLTSTLFGYIHTFNTGETWIGIFSAAFIGFAFCVSIRVTGSAWWAIGFHASWDWTQTFFYGTADSGMVAHGHYLTTSPAGQALWSGGSAGPEGSLLVIPTVLLVILASVLVYGRNSRFESPSSSRRPQLS
jgi:membrane protease YdiL (CAAX protease family)